MNILHAVILGIVQGLAEFLPVSSSGHLVLVQSLFGINEPGITLDVVLHMGTLVPVFIVFRNEIFELIKNPFQKMTALLIIGTIPAVIVVLFFGDIIEGLFSSTKYLALCFIITGFILIVADRISEKNNLEKNNSGKSNLGKEKSEKDVSIIDAFIVGCFQGMAIIPGISRSGSTITGSLFRGFSKETAARFSFLLSIPAILGSAVLQIFGIVSGKIDIDNFDLINMGAGFIAAALSGYLAIRFMLELIKKAKLKYFSIYVFILATALLVYQFFA